MRSFVLNSQCLACHFCNNLLSVGNDQFSHTKPNFNFNEKELMIEVLSKKVNYLHESFQPPKPTINIYSCSKGTPEMEILVAALAPRFSFPLQISRRHRKSVMPQFLNCSRYQFNDYMRWIFISGYVLYRLFKSISYRSFTEISTTLHCEFVITLKFRLQSVSYRLVADKMCYCGLWYPLAVCLSSKWE